MKKVKLTKKQNNNNNKARKDFDQGTVIIKTPSSTASEDFDYLLLSKFPLPKTSILSSAFFNPPPVIRHRPPATRSLQRPFLGWWVGVRFLYLSFLGEEWWGPYLTRYVFLCGLNSVGFIYASSYIFFW